jgi:uncharacterized damage-inducible protein DinB
MERSKWTSRTFASISDNGLLPGIIERLSGTAARIAEKIQGLNNALLEKRPIDKWSIKEEIGHLGDLESLWMGRIEDFSAGLSELRPADMSNQKTYGAGHQEKEINELLLDFRQQRIKLVDHLRTLNEEQLSRTSMHPRLKTPMRIIDLAYFIAEHDDHHLANMSSILYSSKN